MRGSRVNIVRAALIVLAGAVLVFSGLAALGVLKPPSEHQAVAQRRAGGGMILTLYVFLR